MTFTLFWRVFFHSYSGALWAHARVAKIPQKTRAGSQGVISVTRIFVKFTSRLLHVAPFWLILPQYSSAVLSLLTRRRRPGHLRSLAALGPGAGRATARRGSAHAGGVAEDRRGPSEVAKAPSLLACLSLSRFVPPPSLRLHTPMNLLFRQNFLLFRNGALEHGPRHGGRTWRQTIANEHAQNLHSTP